jgi:hypothetical protein
MATFSAAQLDSFFTNGPQMALSPAVRARLASEGLESINDFDDFKEDQLNQAFKNMRTTIPSVPGILEVRDAEGNITTPAVAAIPSIPQS